MPVPVLRTLRRPAAWSWLLVFLLAAGILLPVGASHSVQALVAEAEKLSTAEPFDEAWRLVRDHFYDRSLKGLDWEAIGETHRARYRAAATAIERSAAINAMLGELGVSHTRHYTDASPAYYQLADIFSHSLRNDIPRHFPGGKIAYPGIGIFTREIDGRTFVSGILAGFPADGAGLLVGDEILSVDDAPYAPVDSFRDRVGRQTVVRIRRVAEGPVLAVAVTPELIAPGEAFAKALSESARIIERNGRRIGYVHVWSYAGSRYQNALEHELSVGRLKDADALVWDLRDGWGGAQPHYLDIFNPRAPIMTMIQRDGDASLANFRWRKPVALLINGGTRSGKEVLTHGFKTYRFGEVIGTTTAGALLAARAFLLSDGSLLLLAVNDVAVDGERLEGKGVAPTIQVPFELPYAAGRDPQLEKAIDVLADAPRG